MTLPRLDVVSAKLNAAAALFASVVGEKDRQARSRNLGATIAQLEDLVVRLNELHQVERRAAGVDKAIEEARAAQAALRPSPPPSGRHPWRTHPGDAQAPRQAPITTGEPRTPPSLPKVPCRPRQSSALRGGTKRTKPAPKPTKRTRKNKANTR